MAMCCMSEKGPLRFVCLSAPRPDDDDHEKPCMQSSPVISSQPSPDPCNLVHAHTGTAHPVHCGLARPTKRRRLLRAETLEEDFPVIDLAFPRFFGSFNRREIVAKIP